MTEPSTALATQAEDNKAFVRRFFDAMNNGDSQTIVDSYAQEGEVWTMGATLISGHYNKEQITASCDAIFDSFPEGITFTIDAMTAEGERVAVEAHSEGLHQSGQIYSNEYHFLFIIREGKLFRLKEYMDTERVTDILCGGQRPA